MAYYFIPPSKREGTCYYEFYAGTWDPKKMEFWRDDSILINELDFNITGLENLIAQTVPHYDPYAITPVTKQEWEIILQKAAEAGGELKLAVEEASSWVQENFRHHDVFTILGL